MPRVTSASTQERDAAAAAATMWTAVKDTVFDPDGAPSTAKALAKPVDELYGAETRLTEIDRYMLRGVRVAEKTFRREQVLQTAELARIARARKVGVGPRALLQGACSFFS